MNPSVLQRIAACAEAICSMVNEQNDHGAAAGFQQAPMSGNKRAPLKPAERLLGRYVICRCAEAGVHAGVLVSVDGGTVYLESSRRLWAWKARSGIALSGVAVNGIVASESKVDSETSIVLNGVIEIIACSREAEATIHGA